MKTLIAPSMLACSMLDIGGDIKRISPVADFIHCDVMDGVYVPNISFGFDVISAVGSAVDVPLDVHMMTVAPGLYIDRLKACGASVVTIHHDCSCRTDVISALKAIRETGMKAGLSIRPKFPPEDILPFLEYIDLALVMTVEPGFGGQSFIDERLTAVERIRSYIDKAALSVNIEVDGGINEKTARLCRNAGADILVAGTYLFRAENVNHAAELLRG